MKMSDTLSSLLNKCIETGVSDLHISVGTEPIGRLDGELSPILDGVWTEEMMNDLIEKSLSDFQLKELYKNRSLDSACSLGKTRFRVNIYYERGYPAWAVRRLESKMRTVDELELPQQLIELADLKDGLVLFTGPTGSGKSTSLATIINSINENRSCHILTIEDPIEYLHENKKSLVHQRELGLDVSSFSNSLREALREDPDVILVGEMRDLDTMRAALTAAETGHLVFSTLHCADTVGAVDRILAMYPADEQGAIQRQLGMTLKAVVAQRLLPRSSGQGRIAAIELLKINSAVSNLIKTSQFSQIYSVLETSTSQGMLSSDLALAMLVCQGDVDLDVAQKFVRNNRYFEDSCSMLNSGGFHAHL